MDIRAGKIKFPTNRICAKGFARTLHIGVTNKISDRINYDELIDKMSELLLEHPTYPDDGLFTKVRFEDWWNGDRIPSKKNRELVDLIFNGFSDRWLSRTNFTSRLQMYLASVDLKYVSIKNPKKGMEEAIEILEIIRSNWKPTNTNQPSFDLNIKGSLYRAGYCKLFDDIRAEETYDLGMYGYPSDVGVEIPSYIAKIYQESDIFSIIPYMFCILSLNINDNKTDYKHDLGFDLLSAINCVNTLIPDLWKICFSNNDINRRRLFSVSHWVYNLIHDEVNLPDELLNKIEYYKKLDDVAFTPPELLKHPICSAPNLFINILSDFLSEDELIDLHEKTINYGGNKPLWEGLNAYVEAFGVFKYDLSEEINKDKTCLRNLKSMNGLESWEISKHSIKIFSDFMNSYYTFFRVFTGLEPNELTENIISMSDSQKFSSFNNHLEASVIRF